MALQKTKIFSIGWLKGHKIISFFLLIILAVAGIFVYEKVAYEMNKRAFAQAKTAIDSVFADIVRQVGPPDDKKFNLKCHAIREVYGDGPTSCTLTIYFIYPIADKARAD